MGVVTEQPWWAELLGAAVTTGLAIAVARLPPRKKKKTPPPDPPKSKGAHA